MHVFEPMSDKSVIALVLLISGLVIWPQWALGASAVSSPSQESSEKKVSGSSPRPGPSSDRVQRRDSPPGRPQTDSSATRKSFRGPKVIVVDDRDSSVSVQQTQQQAAPVEAKPTPKKKIYQPSRWVVREHGVEVLEHGRWVEAEAEKEY